MAFQQVCFSFFPPQAYQQSDGAEDNRDGRCSKLGTGHQSQEVSSDFEQAEQVALPALITTPCSLERHIERAFKRRQMSFSKGGHLGVVLGSLFFLLPTSFRFRCLAFFVLFVLFFFFFLEGGPLGNISRFKRRGGAGQLSVVLDCERVIKS